MDLKFGILHGLLFRHSRDAKGVWSTGMEPAVVPTVATIPLPGETLGISGRMASGPSPRIALRSFFAGPENALVDVAVRSVLESGVRRYSPLVLIGPTASGKSHVARGLARHWTKAGKRGQVVCTTAAEFAQDLARDLASHCLPKFHARYRTAALLIVEDLASLAGKGTASIEFIATLEAVQHAGGTVIVTSREIPSSIAGLLPSLASRLTAGLVVPMALPDAAARLAILQELATARGIALSEDASRHLAQGLCVSVPELFSALLEVSERATVVDSSTAKAYLTKRFEQNRPSIALIAAVVAKENQLSVKQLKSASRSRSIVTARNQGVYLARVLTGSSLESIGEFFGKRDHTTILHSYRRVQELLQTDPVTKDAIGKLRKQLERS